MSTQRLYDYTHFPSCNNLLLTLAASVLVRTNRYRRDGSLWEAESEENEKIQFGKWIPWQLLGHERFIRSHLNYWLSFATIMQMLLLPKAPKDTAKHLIFMLWLSFSPRFSLSRHHQTTLSCVQLHERKWRERKTPKHKHRIKFNFRFSRRAPPSACCWWTKSSENARGRTMRKWKQKKDDEENSWCWFSVSNVYEPIEWISSTNEL